MARICFQTNTIIMTKYLFTVFLIINAFAIADKNNSPTLHNRLCWQTDPLHDDRSQLIAEVWEDDNDNVVMSRTFLYDLEGHLIEEVLHGHLSHDSPEFFTVDANGWPLTSNVESLSKHWAYENGLLTCFTEELNKTQRLETLYTYSDGEQAEFIEEYVVDSMTEERQVIKKSYFIYDKDGRLIHKQIFDSQGTPTTSWNYTYDADGNPTEDTNIFDDHENSAIEHETDVKKPKQQTSWWKSTKRWLSSAANYLQAFKKRYSYTEHMEEEWDLISHNTFNTGFLHFSGYYRDEVETGRTPYGEEIDDKVRITLINGILNVKSDLEESLRFFSNTHGDTVVHYVFRPTEGWSRDICNSILLKFGYTSSYAKLLAAKWKEMITEMGGPDGGGTIIHYAHSIGTADTYMARNLLSPEEQRMIHVITLGSPTMIPHDAGFLSSINYVSKRDGVCLLDPVAYMRGWIDTDSNIAFLGSFWGVPLVDHTLFTETYGAIIRELGSLFVNTYQKD